MADPLFNHIVKLVPSFEHTVNEVLPYFEKKIYPKDYTIIAEQNAVDTFYFVVKGCLHLYYTDSESKQNTVHFALENWWITEYHSFLGNPSAQFGVACLEETELMVITKVQFDKLLLKFPFMGVYFNAIHMKAYGASLLRQKNFATVSKKDFYSFFKSTYPDFFKRVPPAVLASYMGISPEELTFFNENIRS